jgi:hypothetical protein
MLHPPTNIPRRTALKLVGLAGAGAAGMGRAVAAPTSAKLDLTTPDGQLHAFILMRGALDERLVVGCVQGLYYGVIDDVLTPLFGVNAATFARYKPTDDGGYETVSFEEAFFTDLATGAVMESWVNPYTNETVTVPKTESEPRRIKINKDLTFELPPAGPTASVKHALLPIEIIGNDVWFTEQTFAAIQRVPTDKPYHYNELTTLHARLSDLDSPHAKRVPCETHFNATVSWRPWMKMGDRPGHMLGNGAGLYGTTMSALSPIWTEATLKARPQVIHDTLGMIEPVWKTLGAPKPAP